MTPISAADQFKAVAYLRWRLFANSFRRKGGVGEVIARFFIYPIAAMFIFGPCAAAFGGAYAAIEEGHPGLLAPIFWLIFAVQILVSINIAQPGLAFDPESLIRFPVTFTRYLVVRLFLGLLSASTIIGTLALLAAATGVTVADHSLALPAYAAALILAVANMLFVRMIFAWVDRWLSTRRARELFTGLIIAFSLGIQYVNFYFNPGFNRGHQNTARITAASHYYHVSQPILANLPPSLAASTIIQTATGHAALALLPLVAIAIYAALFLAIFAWRMQREYRGESLSDSNVGASGLASETSVSKSTPATPVIRRPVTHTAPVALTPLTRSAVVSAAFAKEWIYIRRNTSQLYGLLAPLAMVFLFTARFGSSMRNAWYLFPAVVAYSILGIAALAYNSLGLDAAGVQFYFIAPIQIGSVLLAKNLFSFALNAVEFAIIFALITWSGAPPSPTIFLETLLWAIMAALVNATAGNIRSITAPKKIDPGKLSRRQASQLSAIMSLAIMLVVGGLGAAILLTARFLNMNWLPIPIFAALLAGAAALYWNGLNRLDTLALKHRETLIEELCKNS